MTATPARAIWARRAVAALVVVTVVVLLFPVLANPVVGDDRYWYLGLGADGAWSPMTEIRLLPEVIDHRLNWGRANFLTEIERRVAARAVIEAAQATSTSVTVFVGLLKAGLLAAGLATVVAMVRSVRWREGDDLLVAPDPRSLALVTAAGAVTVAVGARPMAWRSGALNGWIGYPVVTYGAVVGVFGIVALTLWLARVVAERGRRACAFAVGVLVVIGLLTNVRTELAFVAVPVVLLALLVVPVTPRSARREGRRSKAIVAAAYLTGFLPLFVVLRLVIADRCDRGGCYAGVQTDLGGGLLRTAFYNVVSTIPGSGGDELAESAGKVRLTGELPVVPTPWSVLVGLLVVVALALVWWATPTRAPAPDDTTVAERSPNAQGTVLVLAAALCLAGGLGAALVMALSGLAQDMIAEPGILYRNAVVTWTGLAFAAVLLVVAAGCLLPPRASFVSWAAFAVLVGVVAALTLPASSLALRANRLTSQVSTAILDEVTLGDTGPPADARRCELVEETLRAPEFTAFSRRAVVESADDAFQRYYGVPFCSDASVMAEATQE